MDRLNEAWDRVFDKRGVLLVGGQFPPGYEFGLDCMSYETGSKFQGITHLPCGIHFIYYSCGSFQRQGLFVEVTDQIRLVYVPWNSSTEELEPKSGISNDQLAHLCCNILQGSYNDGLGLYNEKQYSLWKNLTQFIDKVVLKNAGIGLDVIINSGNDELDSEDMIPLKRLLRPAESTTSLNGDLVATILSFTDVNNFEQQFIHRLYQADSLQINTDITMIKVDKSRILEQLLQEKFHGLKELLLGEMQLAFIMFMMLYSHQGLEQWKIMLSFICQCESFLISHIPFTCNFIQILFHELKFIPDDFFEAEISKENFLLPAFSNLLSAVSENTDAQLQESVQRFNKFVYKKFGLEIVKNTIHIEGSKSKVDYICSPETEDDTLQLELFKALKEHLVGKENDGSQALNLLGDFNIHQKFSSATEKEIAQYSWRFPLLCESMIASNGKEDILMTAMRILDESECIDVEQTNVFQSRNEAISFLEQEGLRYS